MRKEIRITDQKRGIVQVTIADERWYMRQRENPETKLPEFVAVPSVTWIAHHYPKGVGYMKWLAENGWDESQALMREAGDRGSKVHEALSAILENKEVRIDSKFINKTRGVEEELTLEEVDCIKSFVDWKNSLESFEPVVWDYTVFSEQHNYAGTIDLIARVNGVLTLIDFKTSQKVWPSHEMQVSAYHQTLSSGENSLYGKNENGTEKQVDVAGMQMAVLQVGYRLNKNMWKWNPIEDKFHLFLAAKQIWAYESGNQAPKVRDYPIVISPGEQVGAFELDEEGEVIEVEAVIPVQPELIKTKKPKNGKSKESSDSAQDVPQAQVGGETRGS